MFFCIPRLRGAFHRLAGGGKGALHQQGKVGVLQGVCQRVHLCPAGKIALHPVQKTGDGGLVLVKPCLCGGSCQRVGQRGQLTAPRLPGGIQTAQGVVEHFAPLSLHTGVGAAQIGVVLHTVKIQKRRAAACKFQRVLLQGLFHQCAVMHRTPAGIRFDDSFRPAASGPPHRLLSGDVKFKDLGLVIIDEEQRFGVKHKEKLKESFIGVDMLTLSATPIPRTLNMALSGIRDMSTIEQPPCERQPIETYVLEYDEGIVSEAIRKELARGGQVYYLHNRVESSDSTASRLRQLLGDGVVVETAHGKMAEGELSRVMGRMAQGDIQVLVCTTIIETGIDIPNVNTLIIEDADRMGLSQLHQIRGRIGRSNRRAYAYLTFRVGKVLTEVAAKRLTAIREYVEFGSGFKIAMRDLEIRGAGNLLGPEQSGYMMSVGYDMYLKLLNDAVLEQQGRGAEVRTECSADLTVPAYIPEGYVPAAEQRMDLYRRIAALRTPADEADLMDELLDRYGDVPKPVTALLNVAMLRAAAMETGITDITQKGRQLIYSGDMPFEPAALLAVRGMAGDRDRLQLAAGASPKLTLFLQPREDALDAAGGLVEQLRLQQNELQLQGQQPQEGGNEP